MARLGDIGRIITGNTPSTSDTQNYASNDICFVKPSDIASDDVTILDDTEFHIAEYAREKARVLPPRCVLVTCIGIIGKVAINALECSFNQQINAIIPDTQKCVPEYVAYALFNKQAELQANANAPVVPIMNKSQFSDIKIYIPSLQEQEDVVRKLTRISALISLRKQQIAKLDELVKARFVEMFGDITETVPLSYYIAALIAGKSLAGEEVCPNKVLKTGAATYDYFDPTQIKNLPVDYEPQEEHRVNTGDVIISRMNTAELVGAAAYVWEAPKCTYLPDRLWRAEMKDTACPIFVWQILIQSSTKDSIRCIASGTSGSMKNISKPGLLGIHVKKVPLNLQHQFAAFVAQTNQQKLTIQHSLAQLELLKKALMQKYFG